MPKTIATDWKVVINGVILSDHAFDVAIADEKEQIDVSGFSPTGAREYLPGQQEQGITIQFLNDWATSSVHATLYPLYSSGSTFPMWVQPDSDIGTSATNPIYGGSANIYSYPPTASLGERVELTVEFKPAPNSKFNWGTSFPPP